MSTPAIDVKAEIQVPEPLSDHVNIEMGTETQSSSVPVPHSQTTNEVHGFWHTVFVCILLLVISTCFLGSLFVVGGIPLAAITITTGFGWVMILIYIAQSIAPDIILRFLPLDLQLDDYWVYLSVGLAGAAAIGAILGILGSLMVMVRYIRHGGRIMTREEIRHRGRATYEKYANRPKGSFVVRMALKSVDTVLGTALIPVGSCAVRWWYGPGAGDDLDFQTSVAVGAFGVLVPKLIRQWKNRGEKREIMLDGPGSQPSTEMNPELQDLSSTERQ